MTITLDTTTGRWIVNGQSYATSADAIAAKRTAEYEAGGVDVAAKRPKATKTASKRRNA